MAEVIHIDGLSTKPLPGPVFIEAGTSLLDLVRRFGGTIRVEHVPDQPREISADAAEFIATYEREDPDSVLAVYWRYHSLYAEELDTVEEAESYLRSSEEYGELAGQAVVDGDRIIVYP